MDGFQFHLLLLCVASMAFLHVFVKNDILQLGAYDHSVLYATAQLTEGRSARDQPKQPPAKKLEPLGKPFSRLRSEELVLRLCFSLN